MTDTITLREITKDTARTIMNLKVSPGQEMFVAPNAVSIAQAYFERDTAWFRAIYAGDEPIGFVMVEDSGGERDYYLWRFMIDGRFQRKGYGRQALDLVIAHVRSRPNAKALETSVVPGEGGPKPFYLRAGFVDTGRVEEEEQVLRLEL